ncbi:MAG TPA: tRNA (adenosine(37)-N6)-dimethylallyltransferase MiaA [Clostridiales bacterium]|nr:tRNA (adenosine(37)-N6)-dimethylallyltransferase MiaA [Clostridiales bacterium]
MDKIPLVVITGPTATGKTDLAIQIASRLNGEIVSADSMQIYRYMDIGTAKPSIEERRGIPHHMIDIVDPDEEYNAALYQKQASQIIRQIAERGRLPVLAGGTGLYINSIIYPMNFTDAVEDPEYRSYLNEILERYGAEHLHSMLSEIDPDTAARLHPNDTRRVIRAMEVYHLTGNTMENYRQNYREMDSDYHLLLYGLTMDRQKLYERINLRVDRMMKAGLVEEVKGLLERGYTKNLVSMQGLGYKEIIAYHEGLATLEEAVEILKRDTRRFAKRQLTWFKRESRIEWLDMDRQDSLPAIAEQLVMDIKEKLSL